ncbi:hypothetical protein M493_11425 [Geobacillus genomosp. 3]|uniref:Uncharacterized protein n=1 Tax=Geobacillus genomosp. 3 TaxID=1921421 RepID=S5ZPY2_GEOG3|nr:hypothetical protein M493_11425 [Geobacillus genomosp. 3]
MPDGKGTDRRACLTGMNLCLEKRVFWQEQAKQN